MYIAFEKIQLNEHTVLICTGKDIKQRDICQRALSMTEFNDPIIYIYIYICLLFIGHFKAWILYSENKIMFNYNFKLKIILESEFHLFSKIVTKVSLSGRHIVMKFGKEIREWNGCKM